MSDPDFVLHNQLNLYGEVKSKRKGAKIVSWVFRGPTKPKPELKGCIIRGSINSVTVFSCEI